MSKLDPALLGDGTHQYQELAYWLRDQLHADGVIVVVAGGVQGTTANCTIATPRAAEELSGLVEGMAEKFRSLTEYGFEKIAEMQKQN